MNIKELSMDELNAVRKEIEGEINRRNEEQKRSAWLKVREAMAEYLNLFGEIKIETWDSTYKLNKRIDMSKCGVFDMEGC